MPACASLQELMSTCPPGQALGPPSQPEVVTTGIRDGRGVLEVTLSLA